MVRLRSPAPYSLGEFPSGQRGQTVNLLSLTSLVRIQLPPPNKNTDPCGRYFYLVRELGEQLRRQSRALCRIPPTAVSGVTRRCNKQSEQAVRPFQILPRVAIPGFPSDPCGRYFYLARCADSVRHLLCKCAGSHSPPEDRRARSSGAGCENILAPQEYQASLEPHLRLSIITIRNFYCENRGILLFFIGFIAKK